jgi:hypothetical protein
MKKIIFYLLVVGLFCSLRCKEGPEEPKPIKPYDQRDQFVGTYMVKHDSGYYYKMIISKIDSGETWYLKAENVANMFTNLYTTGYQKNVFQTPLNMFTLGGHFGVRDKYNRTWDIGVGYDDTTTVERENTLVGKQIVLYYRLQNMPWWSVEGVPYHFAFHKHIATKIY